MTRTPTLIAICLVAAVIAGCRRTDVREFSVHMPTMTTAGLPKVQAALAKYGGVQMDSLKYDPATKTLHLHYDSMQIAKKNIEMAIAETGHTANGVTPQSIGANPAK